MARVLIGDAFGAPTLTEKLLELGFQVDTVTSYSDLAHQMDRNSYACLIIDPMMAPNDGQRAIFDRGTIQAQLKALRENQNCPPIIIVSNLDWLMVENPDLIGVVRVFSKYNYRANDVLAAMADLGICATASQSQK